MSNSTTSPNGWLTADTASPAVKKIIGIVHEYWHRSCSRRELMALDARDLRDLRLTRADAMREARKSFWKE